MVEAGTGFLHGTQKETGWIRSVGRIAVAGWLRHGNRCVSGSALRHRLVVFSPGRNAIAGLGPASERDARAIGVDAARRLLACRAVFLSGHTQPATLSGNTHKPGEPGRRRLAPIRTIGGRSISPPGLQRRRNRPGRRRRRHRPDPAQDGRRTLVQCKQWKRQQVGVSIVREMYGLLAHHQAHAVKIACVGTYTKDAKRFAQSKPIELISGQQLLAMIRAVQQQATAPPMPPAVHIEPVFASTESTVSATIATPNCPRCGSTLVQRRNRRTSEHFIGCSQFPKCRGTV